ncbi:MAG: histidine phosphatase family protein [Candidatus Izemoplasmatales bacterium]|nr:histidine phosphatase family protein [Candidatus Izemoplasmatales bacterium]MDD5602128.1 histidine phosphatase family protein [Candidatus Izemoplasmatales bacterium]
MNELIMVRHGETDANHQYLVQGRTDNPLNAVGKEQAVQTARFFLSRKEGFSAIYSSPLTRAFETAEIIRLELAIAKEIIVHPGLIERNFGDYDGEKINDAYYEGVFAGTLPHMEKNAELEKRVDRAIREICEENPGQRILIVTHSHVIKSVLVRALPNFTYASLLNNCSVNSLTYSNGIFQVQAINISPLKK